MTRRRRSESVVLNCDGLTDAVTNLTGTLILLVVLIFGITTEARIAPPSEAGEAHEGRPIDPLVEETEILKLQIQQVDREIRRLEGDLPRLEQQAEDLQKTIEEAHQRQPDQSKPPLQVRRASSGYKTAAG
ncbi:MAG: cell envelope integrity protein TolA [Planctomycetes bacterium]|nr:cell envelope integrity protein TolA [Planctomycetota bacterium]